MLLKSEMQMIENLEYNKQVNEKHLSLEGKCSKIGTLVPIKQHRAIFLVTDSY